jgi:Tfp pilus assembly protein PilN
MKDLNFFINPHAKRDHAPISRILIIAIVVIALAVGGLYFFLNNLNTALRQEIQLMEDELAAPAVATQIAAVNAVSKQLQLLKRYDEGLTTIEAALKVDDRIAKATLDTIAAAIPETVTLTSLSITSSDLMLEATSTDLTANAELVRNFKDTGLFTTVELLSATRSDAEGAEPDGRSIVIHATLQEVMPE